jgi:hypothetical protein
MNYVARSKMVAARMLGDEMVIMSAKDSTLFTLNPVGTVIWNAADGQITLEQIVEQRVCAEFDIQREEAMADAQGFVGQLVEHGILVIAEEPIG